MNDAIPQRLYLVDGSGYIFRAYHALPPLTRPGDGAPVGAVSGFCNMLFKLLRDMQGDEAPTHLAVIFDAGSKTFRNDLYPEYKAHRPPCPEDLVPQFPLVREATRAFGVPAIELDGFEADDLIAAYAKTAAEAGFEVVIVSSDKDLMQLVNDQVSMFDPVKAKRLGREAVIEKFGVPPENVIDVQALIGDPVDNVPGAPGIGVKTASALIEEYGDLDTLLARASEIKQNKRRETLIDFADQIRLSRELVRLKLDTPLPLPLADLTVRDPDAGVLTAFLESMGFRSLNRRAAALTGASPAAPASSPEAAAATAIDRGAYRCLTQLADLQAYLERAKAAAVISFDTETDALSSSHAGLVGVSLALAPGDAVYIPLAHAAAEGLALLGDAPEQIPLDQALAALKPVLEDDAILKVGQNIKYDLAVMQRYGIDVAPYDDTMLISYVLEGGLHGHGMDELSELHLGHKPIAFKEVAGSGKATISFKYVELDKATAYAAEDADVTLRLYLLLKPRLITSGRLTVYETLERGLPKVLADMELAGIAIDPEVLRRLSNTFGQGMAEFEVKAQELAGRPFNLASPRQIGEILFDEKKLAGGKRTATGAWSTDASALDDLAAAGEPLAQTILDWRQLQKLKGTYTDALVQAADPKTGRVHTSFALAATSTGRLSSSDPNLQNIPVRNELGRQIRAGFIAPKGSKLISADYSQIELRLLAHIGDIPALKDAFAAGIDIHAMTASEVFGVPLREMTSELRRRAKAINFGIVYGISAFGLANQLSIPQGEAADYIRAYFAKFPGIKAYMDKTKAQVRETGYVETLFGRRIHIPAIKGKSQAERSFGERAAINAPIQGAAADIIRRAMIRMPQALAEAGLSSRMLLQVHDELLFETPDAEVQTAIPLIRKIMEQAAEPAVALSVPLVVEARAAVNWDEAH